MRKLFFIIHELFRKITGLRAVKAGNPGGGILVGAVTVMILFVVPVLGPIVGGTVAVTISGYGSGRGMVVGFLVGLLGAVPYAFGIGVIVEFQSWQTTGTAIAVSVYGAFLGMIGGLAGGAFNEEDESRLINETARKTREEQRSNQIADRASHGINLHKFRKREAATFSPKHYQRPDAGFFEKTFDFIFDHEWILKIIVIGGLVAGIVYYFDDHYKSIRAPYDTAETELANVELAVAACMAAPDIPIRDLLADARVGTPVICDPSADANVKTLATDPADGDYSLTYDVNTLMPVNSNCTGTPMQPLTNFTNANQFDNWYCVYPDGRVVGFISIEPFTNIREID